MMNEALLHFIWKYSLYNPAGLQTTAGEKITVIHPGTHNHDAGPDFGNARIRIGNTLLAGNVELHIRSSDWKAHGHDNDAAYRNIILHVVYNDDCPDDMLHAKLDLSKAIPSYVIDRYSQFLNIGNPIACASQVDRASEITKESWLNRLLAERWEQKLAGWTAQLTEVAGDWRTLLYWRLAHNFGFKVNADAFLALARSLPLNIIAKHKPSLLQVEALLFGQSGLLQKNASDEYMQSLLVEYDFLSQKYGLKPIQAHLWKFLRMRPANFPTVRIAQFAALLHQSVHLFSDVIETWSVQTIKRSFDITASSYWDNHAVFGETQKKSTAKKLGEASIENIIINTIAPLQFLYAHTQGNSAQQEQALQLLTSVSPEQNRIVDAYTAIGWKPINALQTQGLIQLYHHYCTPKKCLNCAVGLSIIKSRPVE